MRKVIHKLFWVWDYEREEKWLNEMADAGWALISVGFFRYEFEKCEYGAYKLCIAYTGMEKMMQEDQLIDFMEETGAEYVGCCNRWQYFRRRAELGPFEMYSDNASRAQYMNSIKKFIIFVGVFNLLIGFWNIYLYALNELLINLIGFLSLAIGALALFGVYKLQKRTDALRNESKIFE